MSGQEFHGLRSALGFRHKSVCFIQLSGHANSRRDKAHPTIVLRGSIKGSYSPALVITALADGARGGTARPARYLIRPRKLRPSVIRTRRVFAVSGDHIRGFTKRLAPRRVDQISSTIGVDLTLGPVKDVRGLGPVIHSATTCTPPRMISNGPPICPCAPVGSSFRSTKAIRRVVLCARLRSTIRTVVRQLRCDFAFGPDLLADPGHGGRIARVLARTRGCV